VDSSYQGWQVVLKVKPGRGGGRKTGRGGQRGEIKTKGMAKGVRTTVNA